MTCDCEVCKYNRYYLEAVEKNDKEFLIEHLNVFLNVSEDRDYWKWQYHKLEVEAKEEG